jgi:hypothetical protein
MLRHTLSFTNAAVLKYYKYYNVYKFTGKNMF